MSSGSRGKRGPAWYAKYRLPDDRQVKKKLGPAWTDRPPPGHFTKRLAEEWLCSALDRARQGTLPGMIRTGATFADAAAEYLRYIEHDRGRKPSTVRGYRSAIEAHLLPAFGTKAVEDVTTEVIEGWMAGYARLATLPEQAPDPASRDPRASALSVRLAVQRRGGREKIPLRPSGNNVIPLRPSGNNVISPEEVWGPGSSG
jgi:hypothetical protein